MGSATGGKQLGWMAKGRVDWRRWELTDGSQLVVVWWAAVVTAVAVAGEDRRRRKRRGKKGYIYI